MGARIADSELYAHLWGTDELRAIFDERARLQSWLDILAALARAQAAVGIIPPESAKEITAAADVDELDLAMANPSTQYLVPCRGSGFCVEGPATVAFLDERPPQADWTLLGCERSRSIHEWFYGEAPQEAVELCPRRLVPADGGPLLTKCCRREDSIAEVGITVAVPWGASLEQVKQALAAIAKAAEPAWAPA